jgi:hypothetical protein
LEGIRVARAFISSSDKPSCTDEFM